MALFENAVAAKAHAMYGHMLSCAQYNDLVHKQSVPELAAYLKEKTAYGQTLAELNESTAHRGLLETLLRRDIFYQYERLMKYTGGPNDLYQFIVVESEVDTIMGCLREMVSPSGQDPIAMIPGVIQQHAGFDLYALAKASDLDAMQQILGHSPYAALLRECREKHPQAEGEPFPYAAYETVFRTYYIKVLVDYAKKHMHGKAAQQMIELVTLRGEMMNINLIYRIKSSFTLDRAQVQKRLLPFYNKLTPKLMSRLIEAEDTEELKRIMRTTPYAGAFEGDWHMIESVTEKIRYEKARRLMRFASGPQVVYVAFILLRMIELENITRIIEGVRYQLTPEHIESLLCR